MSPRLLRPGGMHEFVRLAAEAAAVGLVTSVVLIIAAVAISTAAEAAPSPAPGTGSLLLKSADGSIPAPLVAIDVSIEVSGIVARTRVTQRFVNPGEDWREGVYVFPLPESAAVDRLEMRIGERRIQGVIRERAAARREYEQAKQQGRKAALVEEERPNLFTTSVAPIGPADEVGVTIEYQQTLRYDNGAFSLRFPMAITPRYLPGQRLAVASGEATGRGTDTDRVPDASRITPPYLDPAAGKGLPVTLKVTIDAGFPLARLESLYHATRVDETAAGRITVSLDGSVPADRDFELSWTPELGHAPGAAVFTEPHGGRHYALLMLMPSLPSAGAPRAPRELTYVIDTSGSMAGTSIAQAKAALLFALERLKPGDRFNVIEFNSKARALFDQPMPFDPATLARARSFVRGLRASGGTEMREALALALGARRAEDGLVGQVVFLTDGAVGNESELFALIRDRLGERRLFTVGIGSAPNSHFMTKAAQFGRGTFTYIGEVNEVQARMAGLVVKLESPVLTDIELDWPGQVDAWPSRVPDLYAGEPIMVTAALDSLSGEVVMRGIHQGLPYRATLPLSGSAPHAGVNVLWARAKIDALSDAALGGASGDDLRAEIVRVALAHHLVSKHTSLVAVDVTPTAPVGTALRSTAIPGNLPEGQQFETRVTGLPQTASPAARNALIGVMLMLAALLTLHRNRVRFRVTPGYAARSRMTARSCAIGA